jgi:hypothetical protein
MIERSYTLAVASADREAFALCLALGTLEAIRSGSWPINAGASTIARREFVDPLVEAGVPDEILYHFRNADALLAFGVLLGAPGVERRLNDAVAALKARLATLSRPSWDARWEGGEVVYHTSEAVGGS